MIPTSTIDSATTSQPQTGMVRDEDMAELAQFAASIGQQWDTLDNAMQSPEIETLKYQPLGIADVPEAYADYETPSAWDVTQDFVSNILIQGCHTIAGRYTYTREEELEQIERLRNDIIAKRPILEKLQSVLNKAPDAHGEAMRSARDALCQISDNTEALVALTGRITGQTQSRAIE